MTDEQIIKKFNPDLNHRRINYIWLLAALVAVAAIVMCINNPFSDSLSKMIVGTVTICLSGVAMTVLLGLLICAFQDDDDDVEDAIKPMVTKRKYMHGLRLCETALRHDLDAIVENIRNGKDIGLAIDGTLDTILSGKYDMRSVYNISPEVYYNYKIITYVYVFGNRFRQRPTVDLRELYSDDGITRFNKIFNVGEKRKNN